jgi:hypothetical protein
MAKSKKLLLSFATLLINAAVGLVLKESLSYWGILDPLAVFLGNWLKVNLGTSIDLPGILWGVALLFSLLLYIVALFFIWRTNKPHSGTSPAVLGTGKASPGRGATSPSSLVPDPLPSNMTIKGDYAHLGGNSAVAERQHPRPAPNSVAQSESPITTEPQATTSYPGLAGLDPFILYAIDHEKSTVLLNYLPDEGNVPQKAIELILFGNKLLLGLEKTPTDVADYAIQKSKVPLSPIYYVRPITFAFRADSPAERAAGDGMGSRIIRAGLAKGLSLRLDPTLYESTAEMTADLIRRK